MKKVCLKFETILRLREFLDVVALTKYQLDRISNRIIAEMNTADIELAQRCYHAKVIHLQLA
jgi:hypothetical protein